MYEFLQLNHVHLAVQRLGGATKAAHALGVSNTTIHAWVKARRISDIDKARLAGKLTKIAPLNLRSTS